MLRGGSLRLVMESPDRETVLAWLDRDEMLAAPVQASGSYHLRAR